MKDGGELGEKRKKAQQDRKRCYPHLKAEATQEKSWRGRSFQERAHLVLWPGAIIQEV